MKKVMRRQNLLPEENVCKQEEQIILSKGRLIQKHILVATRPMEITAELMFIWKLKGRFCVLKKEKKLNSNIS